MLHFTSNRGVSLLFSGVAALYKIVKRFYFKAYISNRLLALLLCVFFYLHRQYNCSLLLRDERQAVEPE